MTPPGVMKWGESFEPVTPGPHQNFVTGPSLLVNCYLGNKFHKKNQAGSLSFLSPKYTF